MSAPERYSSAELHEIHHIEGKISELPRQVGFLPFLAAAILEDGKACNPDIRSCA
jgi:hypothetical protein